MAHLETPSGTQDIHNREKESVSTLLPVQLRQNSAVFIAFLEDYYEFTNQLDQPTNLIDRISNEHDIDFTSDRFLNEIKKEIARGIPESTVLNNRQLFKKIVDYYYTRGSENSADVFFKLFFDDEVTITYPKETLFKPSDATLNSHGFVDLNGDGSKVQWSNITGDFIKPLTRTPEGGKKAVFIATTTGQLDFMRGTYVYDSTTKRWNHVQEGRNRQFFVYNGAATRWEFARQVVNFYWGFDDGEVRATEEEGFWSVIGGQTNRWKLIYGGPSFSHPGYTVAGEYTTNTIPGLPQNFAIENYPDIRNFDSTGSTAPYLRSSESTALDNAITRGNTVIQDTVLEDNRHINEYYVHYGETEHDFWEVENDAILKSDQQGDNIGEHIEMNTRHIYSKENFIKYPLYDFAYTSAEYNNSVSYIDAYSIRVEQTTSGGTASGRSNEITIPLGKCGQAGEHFRLSGTVHILSTSGQYSGTITNQVYLSSNSKGWVLGTELITDNEHIETPLVTTTGKRGFNISDGTGITGDFELVITRSDETFHQSESADRDGSKEAELTFVSLFGSDFKISNLRLEKCANKFIRIGINDFGDFQVGDVVSATNGGTDFAATTFAAGSSETSDKGRPTGTIIALQDFGTDQKFIDIQPTVVKGIITNNFAGADPTVTVTNPNYNASTPTGFPGGLIEPGMYVTYSGMTDGFGNGVRVRDVVFDQTTQTITLNLGTGTSGTTAGVSSFIGTAGTEITFSSEPRGFLSGSALSSYASRNGGVARAGRTMQDNGFAATDHIFFHKDYNRNKQLNSFWYTGNRDRSETLLRAHVYDTPGVDPEGQTFFAKVPTKVTNSNKVVIVDYENLPRTGMKMNANYKPGGRYNQNHYEYGFPDVIAPTGGQSFTTSPTSVIVTGKVITDAIASLTFNGNVYNYSNSSGIEMYTRTIVGGIETFKKSSHGSTAIADGAVEGSWNPAIIGIPSMSFDGRFGGLPADLGKGRFPTHQTDTSLFTIQYTTPADKTGTEFLVDTFGGNQVVLPGMFVSGTGISGTGNVRVVSVEHDDSIVEGARKITLDTSVTLANDTTLSFHNESDLAANYITGVNFKRPTYAQVDGTYQPTNDYTSGDIKFKIKINNGSIPPLGTVVNGPKIKKGSYIKEVSNQGTNGSKTTVDITLSDQSSSTCQLINDPHGTNKTKIRVRWFQGEQPNNTQWVAISSRSYGMYKTAGGSAHKKNYDDGGLGSVNGNTLVTSVTKVTNYYKTFDIVLDTPQPYLKSGDYVSFRNVGTGMKINNNSSLKFTLCEIVTKNKNTIHTDGGWIGMAFRGIRQGGHYYQSEHDLPFFDNRNSNTGDVIVSDTTDLIELGTYEGNTHIYGKDEDDNVFTIQQPRQFPHQTNNPKIPSDTVVFSDKHFALAGKGKDAYVLPLNMYGKDFMGLNVSHHLGQYYGYALEDCTVKYFEIEQHRDGRRLGDEHTMNDDIHLLGPKAEETDVLLTRQSNVSYYYGRDQQTYYEVKVSGDYSPYIDDNEESIILRDGQTLNYAESKNLLVGDIFTPKITEAGSILLEKGLRVKAAPSDIKHVKAGDKFTFTMGRHYTRAEDLFVEVNTLSGSHGRHYLALFECSGRCVIAQSGESQTEMQMILSPASEKTLGFRRGNASYGPFTQTGREGWYIADHGRLGWNGIPIESAQVIHDFGEDEHTRSYQTTRHYLVTRGAVNNSTTYEYDSTTFGFEDHAEALVPGIYCEIALGKSVGSQTGNQIQLDTLRGTITPGLEVQIQSSKFTSIDNPGTAVTVVSVDAGGAGTGTLQNGTATITLSDTITGINGGAYIGFYAKVATTPTRVSYASKRITSTANFFDRPVTMVDNWVIYVGPYMGGDVTNLNCTNQNTHNDISRLRILSTEPYPTEAMKFTGGFLGSNVRRVIRKENNDTLELTDKVTCIHGETVTGSMPDFPAVMKIQFPLSHEIYWGDTNKLGKLKNLGYSGTYNPNDNETNILIGYDRDDIYIPAYSVAKVNGATSSSTIIKLDDHVRAQDPLGNNYDNGMIYPSPYDEDSKKYPSYSEIFAKIKVGMEVSGSGVSANTVVTAVRSQDDITVNNSLTLTDNTTLTFRAPAGTYTNNVNIEKITSPGETPPAHVEFIGIGHTVDKGNHTGHYDESIGDPLYHIHYNDSQGVDSFMALPVEKLKDTYVIPHAITDWAATTIYTNQWRIYFWKSGWKQYGDPISRPFGRQGVTQIQNFPPGQLFGTSNTLITDPSDNSYTPTLWKFEATRPFFLVTNDGAKDEEAVYGFNRNSYANPNYKFFADYDDRKGRVSDINKLHDGDFNQEFSYGLNTTLSLDKWETQYRKLVHPSGTKFFGLLNIEGEVNKTPTQRSNAIHNSGNPKYELTVGQGIEWLRNLKLDNGQHSPKYQPGWLDEVLTALVEIEPLVSSGVTLPSSVTDVIDQLLAATYRFTLDKANGISDITLRTTHVETKTPVQIDTLDLTNFVRPVHINSRDIENSGITGSGTTRFPINKIINPKRIDARTGQAAKPFKIRVLKSNAGPSDISFVTDSNSSTHDLKLTFSPGTFSDDRQFHLRMYGLQSGAKYKVSGKVRVSTNNTNASDYVRVGADISDGYVQENEAARAAGTYVVPNNTTGPGMANINVNPGVTTSFTNFEVTGTYLNFDDSPTIGRNNVAGTHDFIDILARIHHNPANGNYTGSVVVEYRDLKIEEFYMANETIHSSEFDTRMTPVVNNDSIRPGTTPGDVKTDTKTFFTSWHNPISNLAGQSNSTRANIYSVTPLDVPYNTNLRAKIAGGGQPTPVIASTEGLATSRFEEGETITDGIVTTTISKVTDISGQRIYKDGVTVSGFTGSDSFLNGVYSRNGPNSYIQVSPKNGGHIDKEDIAAGTEDDLTIINYGWGIIDGNTTTTPTTSSVFVDRSDSSPTIRQPWQMTWTGGISVVYTPTAIEDATTRLTVANSGGITFGETITGSTSQAKGLVQRVSDGNTLDIKEELGVRTLDFTFN